MDNLNTRLQELQQRADKARTDKARAEATLESLQKQMDQLIAEVKALGVDPDQLSAEITRLQLEIETSIAEAEQLLPKD